MKKPAYAYVICLIAVLLISMPLKVMAATCYQFDTIISATLTGPYNTVQNSVRQPFYVRDQGFRANPFDILFFFPGDANGFATQPGSFELMSNSITARNPGMASAAFDMGVTGVAQDGSFVFQIDPGMAFQQPAPNAFVTQGVSGSAGGLGGICFVPGLEGLCNQTQNAAVLQALYLIPSQGGIAFIFPDQFSIQGIIDMTGYAYGSPNLQGRYQAQFGGALVGAFAC